MSGCWASAAFSPPLLEDPRLAARKYSLDTVAAVTSWLDGSREERSPSVTGETPRRCSGDEQIGESLSSRWEQQAGGNRTRRGLDSDEVREQVETFFGCRDLDKSRIFLCTNLPVRKGSPVPDTVHGTSFVNLIHLRWDQREQNFTYCCVGTFFPLNGFSFILCFGSGGSVIKGIVSQDGYLF
jgi:hypothetical protein